MSRFYFGTVIEGSQRPVIPAIYRRDSESSYSLSGFGRRTTRLSHGQHLTSRSMVALNHLEDFQ
jgi:hypothetical protein